MSEKYQNFAILWKVVLRFPHCIEMIQISGGWGRCSDTTCAALYKTWRLLCHRKMLKLKKKGVLKLSKTKIRIKKNNVFLKCIYRWRGTSPLKRPSFHSHQFSRLEQMDRPLVSSLIVSLESLYYNTINLSVYLGI